MRRELLVPTAGVSAFVLGVALWVIRGWGWATVICFAVWLASGVYLLLDDPYPR